MLTSVAVFAPLAGSLTALLLGRQIGDRAAQAVTILCMLVASVSGVIGFIEHVYFHASHAPIILGTWLQAGSFHVEWALRQDTLSIVMVAMVTFVATLIHIYSVGYMSHDQTIWRFFSYLSLFSFAMLMLVTADNLLQLFFGWEGVGLASYLLIGYWYDRPSACAAAIKAFVVNRVGDLFFAIGIALIFVTFGSISFSDIFGQVAVHTRDTFHLFGTSFPVLNIIGVLLFLGAMGKSAQIGLHVWLPDAMEGPTPVSALIHAATMVTAGVFLMARMSPLMDFAPAALAMVTIVGGTTALFAATIGCVQNDIKRVIAYSTCSQLGYMFVAAGVGAYQVSIFHLLTHAFFKALLFMGAGSVIHAMSDEQDMRKMGGIWRSIPVTYCVMWIGSLALAGIPPFAGYFSKDAILEAAWAAHTRVGFYGYICGLAAAFLTAFYSWRLILMTFHGKPRAERHVMEHVHESPAVMLWPLLILAAGATLLGWIFRDQLIGANWRAFWGASIATAPTNHVLAGMDAMPFALSVAPTALAISGIALAYFMYQLRPDVPGALASHFRVVYEFLYNKWYFDELYDRVFVTPFKAVSVLLWQTGDVAIIDGIPNGLASLTEGGSDQAVRLQSGSLAAYAFSMVIGIVALIAVYLVAR